MAALMITWTDGDETTPPRMAASADNLKATIAYYCCGSGVVAVLGGKMGYITCGCSPVKDLR